MPVRPSPAFRLSLVLLGAVVLGAALCVMKGDAGEPLLNTLGNLSAPYAVHAVLAGLCTRRRGTGALFGVLATEATLGGFYGAWVALLGHEVSLATLAFWGALGLPLGGVCGLIGHAAVARPALRYSIPALLILEPLALRAEIVTSRFGYGDPDVTRVLLAAFGIEVAVGVLLLLGVRTSLRMRRRALPS